MSTLALLTAAILSASPGMRPSVAARYAADIAAATTTLEAGLMLVVTAKAESDFRFSVETCDIVGDNGAARSLYQLHSEHYAGHSVDEICSSNRLASRLAARALGRFRRVTGSVELAFARYVGTSAADRRVKRRIELFERLAAEVADGGGEI